MIGNRWRLVMVMPPCLVLGARRPVPRTVWTAGPSERGGVEAARLAYDAPSGAKPQSPLASLRLRRVDHRYGWCDDVPLV